MNGFLDFETFGGWDLTSRKLLSEEVSPLCCALRYNHHSSSPTDIWIHGEAPNQISEMALLATFHHNLVKTWWAHNLGRFDGLFLAAAAQRLGIRMDAVLAGGSRVISYEFRRQNSHQKVRINDTFALAPDALKRLAVDFDLPSRKLFSDTDYKGDMRALPTPKLREGCFTDCQIGLELLDKLETFVTQAGGSLRRTFSSTSLGILRSQLGEKGIRLPSHYNNPSCNPIARQASYGARVEVLHHCPGRPLVEIDITSSYPAAMCRNLPWTPITMAEGRIAATKAYGDDYTESLIFAKVTQPKTWLPILPYRTLSSSGDTDGIFFPTGTWEGFFPKPELRYAESLGAQITPLKAIVYSQASHFKEFVHQAFEQKRLAGIAGHKAARSFWKFILNGCYGKFGEKPEHNKLLSFETTYDALAFSSEADFATQVIDDCYCENGPNLLPCQSCGAQGRLLSSETFRWAPHTHFGISSYVLGHGRIAIHKVLCDSTNPAYVDTDASHCESYANLYSEELGGAKLEKPRGDWTTNTFRGEYFGPKIYRLTPCERDGQTKPHLAAKGFPVNPTSFNALLRSAIQFQSGRPVEKVPTERMRLLRTQLRKDPAKTIRIRHDKSWFGFSSKRKPFSDGSTEPWTVQELLSKKHKKAVSPAILKLL